MTKTTIKKLTLTRETLRQLDDAQLGQVAGASMGCTNAKTSPSLCPCRK